MKKAILAALVAAPFMLTGCAGFAFSSHGVDYASLYADSSGNERVTEAPVGKKTGEACATSILGLVTTGNAAAAEAARKAGINKIGAVDHNYTNILGLYSKYCVVVSGD